MADSPISSNTSSSFRTTSSIGKQSSTAGGPASGEAAITRRVHPAHAGGKGQAQSASTTGMTSEDNFGQFITSLSASPILWGLLVSIVFYSLIYFGVISNTYVRDYFAGHPVEYATTIMFFVGMAALLITAIGTLWQSAGLRGFGLIFGPAPPGGQPVSDCPALLSRLRETAAGRENDILVRRFRDALMWIIRRNSAEGLEDELKDLAEQDDDRAYENYDLFRVIVWAIPVLGFLGTVIGITLAIGNLNPAALEESVGQVVLDLRIAFATTTQALSLCIVLMFTKYRIAKSENKMLARVDRQVEYELLGRFQISSREADGQLGVVRDMAKAVIAGSEQLVQRQVELWQKSMQESQASWQRMAASAGEEVQNALAAALQESLREHARTLAETEQTHAERNRENWTRVHESLSEDARATNALQSSVAEQVQILHRTVEATGQVARLEDALNRNLAALAGSKNFEQTVMSLAAAIHLLNARLGNDTSVANVQLEPERQDPQAA